MCGIVGIAATAPIAHRAWLRSGREAVTHRGPDDAGEWWSDDGRVGLGHRRLSILDLTHAGHQPMHHADGLTVVFNGEIYNFRELRTELMGRGHAFRSASDTEVLLAAYREWGTECVERLGGMFAFALHDAQRQRVFLARDRAGEKPLFLRQAEGSLRFASELKGLLADRQVPRRVDQRSLDCYLALGYVPGAACILQGFEKLPPAHACTFSLQTGERRMWRYWELPEPEGPPTNGRVESGLVEELERLLEQAVRRQLVADVPVGVLLSGGVDSSLVTAMAVRASDTIRTFTIAFPGQGEMDESKHAQLIARHFGTQHTELPAEAPTAEVLPLLARQYDEPMADSSMVPTFLVSQLVRGHCTVALGGDGGDELFGGYNHYSRGLRLKRQVGWLPLTARRLAARGARRFLPTGMKGRTWLGEWDTDFRTGVPFLSRYFDPVSRRRLLGGAGCPLPAETLIRERTPLQGDLLQRATRMDFHNYLPDDILVKVDRASMLTSLEVRAPFLDVQVMDFAFRQVPSHLKATRSQRKILLRRLARRMLPPAFDDRRKQGFSIPLDQWFRVGPAKDLLKQVLLDPQCHFQRAAVDDLLLGQERGRKNAERLFALLMFELWRQEYQATLG